MYRTALFKLGIIGACAGLFAVPAMADALFGGDQGALKSGSLLAERPAYKTVTDARLREPEAGNWLMYRGRYDSQGFSPLDQINAKNVSDLKPVWSFSTGMRSWSEASKLCRNLLNRTM